MKYFDISEFDCPHCGANEMDTGFLYKLDRAREFAGVPFLITSGKRCETHNKAVGSTSTNHLSGHAADIRCTGSAERFKIIKALIEAGFDRIGIHPKFIHCDDNPGGWPKVIWFY